MFMILFPTQRQAALFGHQQGPLVAQSQHGGHWGAWRAAQTPTMVVWDGLALGTLPHNRAPYQVIASFLI